MTYSFKQYIQNRRIRYAPMSGEIGVASCAELSVIHQVSNTQAYPLSRHVHTSLTATGPNTMLRNRAAGVPTGAYFQRRPSENQCACEVNMLPVKPVPQSIYLRNLWGVPKRFCCALLLLVGLVPRSVAQSVPPPQGTQTDAAFADSFRSNHVSNV